MLRFAHSNGRQAMLLLIAILPLSLSLGCRSQGEISEGARLLLSGEELAPAATMELRFEEPVVDDGQVGRVADPCPLVIRPPLNGTFQWLSRRSGVFTPSQPPPLGREYQISLRSDLRRADGTRLAARLLRRVRAPDFGVEEYAPRGQATNDVSAEPRFHLRFNAEVVLESVAPFIEFKDANGQRVQAKASQARRSDAAAEFWSDLGNLTWEERFYQSHPHLSKSPRAAGTVKDPDIIAHQLVIMPAGPLPVGTNWQLVLQTGLPAVKDSLHLKRPLHLPLGNVLPFEVTDISPINRLNSGKRLQIHFSKSLGEELDGTNVLDWISLDPAPTLLKAAVAGNEVELRGEFQLDQAYTLTVRSGLPGVSGFKLERPHEFRVVFSPIAPRLYFPAFASEQLSAGARKMELLSINVREVRLRAKLLDRALVVHALRGYRNYFKNDFDWEEPYREIDFDLMAGKTIYQTHRVLSAPQDQPVKTELSWDQILSGRRHGAVFLVAEQDPGQGHSSRDSDLPRARMGTQTLVQITDLGLYWKRAGDRLWVMPFSYTTGQPLAETTLRLMNNDGETLQEIQSSREGLTEVHLAADGVWLMAEKEEDLHVVRIASRWEDQLPVDSRIPRDWEESPSSAPQLMLFSDRPVYRPGEELHVKGILRQWTGQRLVIPNQPAAELRCFDGRERQFYRTHLDFTEWGTVAATIPLPETGLGHYRAELRVGTNLAQTHYFQVRQFKPNAFELEIQAPAFIPAGAPVKIPVQAQYYMGHPVRRARLQWSIQAEDAGFQPEGWEEYSFCAQVEPGLGREASSMLWSGETNGALPYVLEPQVPINPVAPQPRALDIQVELTDISQQTLSARARTLRHSSEFYLGLKKFEKVARAGAALPVHLVAVKPDGGLWHAPVKARLRWHKIEWRTVRLQAAGSAASYRSEPEIMEISDQEITTQELGQRGDPGELESEDSVTLIPPSAGLYLLEASTQDSNGRAVLTALTFHAAGPEPLAWNYRNEVQVELAPDQADYLAGQTARLLVKTPISGTAIVTVERDRVFRQFTTHLTGNTPVVSVPIQPGDAPNVFVSVFLLRGLADSPRLFQQPDYRLGYCQLLVRQPDKELQLEISSEQPDYRPGQPVRVSALVKDGTGRPAGNAEVTLFAVDEGVLSLMDYQAPDPLAYFWAPHRLGVWTHSTLPSLLPEDPGEWRFQNKGYLIGGGGKEGFGRVRRNFQACAFWNATLRTDGQGRATAHFPAPDGMTRYRIFAIALTADQFGSGQSAFTIKKPLMVEPALPRFANVGDRLLARAVVHHLQGATGQVEVTLTLDQTARGKGAASNILTRLVKTGSQGSVRVDFPIEIIAAGPAQWTWQARHSGNHQFHDAVQSTLPVGHATPLLREVLARRIGTETDLLQGINPQLLEGSGTLRVAVANTRLAELGEAAAHLLEYPYGCAEQTASSLIPWLVLHEYRSVLPCLGPDSAGMSKAVEHGIDRLLSMQVPRGGLAYWPGGSEAMWWVSAYGGLALVVARQNGFDVPQENLDRLLQYLADKMRQQPKSLDNADVGQDILALYTLARAGQPLAALYEALFARRERLDQENRALLALAILAGQGPPEMAEELLQLKETRRELEEYCFGGPQRTMAIQLLAWLRLHPQNNKVEEGVARLLQARQGGHWTTTQGNAWALLALSEYIRQVETSRMAGTGRVKWGTEEREFRFAPEPKMFETLFTNSASLSGQPMWLRPPGPQTLFSVVTVETRPKAAISQARDHGFSLQREYALVDEEGKRRDFQDARVGDCVLVTLRLEARQAARYVVLEDPWPALLEGINPEFKTQQTRAGEKLEANWGSDFKELRHDRALFFKDFLIPGRYTIQYLARVRAAGTATAPSAKVEEMYHPDRFGLSESKSVKISESVNQ